MLHDTLDEVWNADVCVSDTTPVALLMLESLITQLQASLDDVAACILGGQLAIPAVQTASALTRTVQSLTADFIRLKGLYEALPDDSTSEFDRGFSQLESRSFEVIARVKLTRDALQTLIPPLRTRASVVVAGAAYLSGTLQ